MKKSIEEDIKNLLVEYYDYIEEVQLEELPGKIADLFIEKMEPLKEMHLRSVRFYKDILEGEGLRPFQEAEYVNAHNFAIEQGWELKK